MRLCISVCLVFLLGQFICLVVSYLVFCVFLLCCCLLVSTSAIDCLETQIEVTGSDLKRLARRDFSMSCQEHGPRMVA